MVAVVAVVEVRVLVLERPGARYDGTRGRTHGERKDRNPALAATAIEIVMAS